MCRIVSCCVVLALCQDSLTMCLVNCVASFALFMYCAASCESIDNESSFIWKQVSQYHNTIIMTLLEKINQKVKTFLVNYWKKWIWGKMNIFWSKETSKCEENGTWYLTYIEGKGMLWGLCRMTNTLEPSNNSKVWKSEASTQFRTQTVRGHFKEDDNSVNRITLFPLLLYRAVSRESIDNESSFIWKQVSEYHNTIIMTSS